MDHRDGSAATRLADSGAAVSTRRAGAGVRGTRMRDVSPGEAIGSPSRRRLTRRPADVRLPGPDATGDVPPGIDERPRAARRRSVARSSACSGPNERVIRSLLDRNKVRDAACGAGIGKPMRVVMTNLPPRSPKTRVVSGSISPADARVAPARQAQIATSSVSYASSVTFVWVSTRCFSLYTPACRDQRVLRGGVDGSALALPSRVGISECSAGLGSPDA